MLVYIIFRLYFCEKKGYPNENNIVSFVLVCWVCRIKQS
jgi:hypothetical protein